MELDTIEQWPKLTHDKTGFVPTTTSRIIDEGNIDAHVMWHNGNVVLIMTPLVARIVHELSGQFSGKGPLREITDKVWSTFEGAMYLDPNDYVLCGYVSQLDEEGEE